MNFTQKKQIEKLKRVIAEATASSAETVKTIINSRLQQLIDSVNSNHKFLELMKARFLLNGLDPNIISTVKNFYFNGIDLSEQMIDTLIEAHSKRLEYWKGYTTELVELLLQDQRFLSEAETEKIIDRVIENFEFISDKSQNELKEIVGLYNKHGNIAMNFNEKFTDPLKKQLESISKLKGIRKPVYNNQASQWWKEQFIETEVFAQQ